MIDKENIKYEISKSKEILFNATIILTDGTQEVYNAICINKQNVKYGRVLKNKIIFYGFIPNTNIKEIRNENKKIIFNN